VLDVWFERDVKPRLKGRAFLIRSADDFVMGFACEADARRVLEVLPKRFGKYGLTLHPDKTRLVPFQRPPRRSSGAGPRAAAQPGVFDLLGFRHCWVRSRPGHWVVRQETAPSRFRAALRRILWQKLRGPFGYYGITGNGKALQRSATR
jgi:RNA-directed DNA polymerase